MKNNRRAEITLGTLAVLGVLAAGGWLVHKVFQPGRNKEVAVQAAQAAAVADALARAEKDKVEAVAAATAKAQEQHARERALQNQIAANASGFVEGAKIALQTNPAPTHAEVVAIGLLESAGTALGQPLTAQQREVWTRTVAGLIARNAEAEAQVQRLTQEAATARAALGEVRARADAADKNVSALTKQLSEHTDKLVESTVKAADLTAQNKQWADGEQNLWGRMKALIILAALLATVLIFLSLKYRGVSSTVKDAVALGEHVKGLAVKAGHGAKELEDEIQTWWEGDKNAAAKYDKTKSQLRI
jgi:hypothetical protein